MTKMTMRERVINELYKRLLAGEGYTEITMKESGDTVMVNAVDVNVPLQHTGKAFIMWSPRLNTLTVTGLGAVADTVLDYEGTAERRQAEMLELLDMRDRIMHGCATDAEKQAFREGHEAMFGYVPGYAS